MLFATSFEEFTQLAKQFRTVYVRGQIPLENSSGIKAYQALGTDESSLIETFSPEGNCKVSFLGIDPFVIISAQNGKIVFSYEKKPQFFEGNLVDTFKALFANFAPMYEDIEIPFFGSFIGFLSYDAVRFFENIPDSHPSAQDFPDILFHLYRTMVIIDYAKGVVNVLELADSSCDLKESYRKALGKIESHIEKLFRPPVQLKTSSKQTTSSVTSDLDDERFVGLVEKAKNYLRQGDIFQVVLSRSFTKPCQAHPLAIYQTLSSINPSPYLFFLNFNGYSIVGASPEKLVSVLDGQIETIPIAGTCPRYGDDLDKVREENLMADPKETAEHMMLVDLARNDLGVVSHPGSVKVSRLKYLQRLSHVTHLVSEVQGQLQEGLTALDALKAAFPAGTLSGAPKIRAMEIIDELESSRRGLYGGAICSFDLKGNMESFLAIRMAILKEGRATVRAGAGIVLDSNPQKEADETRHKAQAILKAIKLTEETLHAFDYR